ncbi:phosphotransferase [Streptomyces profundus]|uniref:phosphotransferase n=1 Tax=Streptomyces profundus TaxID=2867410 RepID=UPI001D164457|nr:phosphotransferase [Streptomyces sp. MA3_2.13]UED87183.1 aminoglycoside phosphotransferase family protein [Streptomyces sp. MA3_2.13]
MDTTDVTALLPGLLADAGLPNNPVRQPIRVWARSGVERLTFPRATSVVFKYAEAPFDREDHALGIAAAAGLPVPAVHAARHTERLLGMLIEDLGEPVREADDLDGATAAVQIHRVAAQGLPRLGEAELSALPQKIARRLARYGATDDAHSAATALTRAADVRAKGAELPPFGLVHSEFHPTSLHVNASGLRVLDLARAFTGPGLLDLASWHGTTSAPDTDRTHTLISSYVRAGGLAAEVLAERGGLDVASWALGWHRVWVAEWFTQQIGLGWAEGAEDRWTTVITRHVLDAAELLNV